MSGPQQADLKAMLRRLSRLWWDTDRARSPARRAAVERRAHEMEARIDRVIEGRKR